MCFSQTVSFSSAAVLIPVGLYTMARAHKYNKHYLLFASAPFIFGVQQLIEGVVWSGLYSGSNFVIHTATLAYLFFAYFLWPVIIPVAVYRIETQPSRKKVLRMLAFAGLIIGLIVYAPLLAQVVPVSTTIAGSSVNYVSYTAEPMTSILILCYTAVVFASLLLSSVKRIRVFGVLVFIAILATMLWYKVVFTSVWCFFAALLSIYIVFVIHSMPNHLI